MELYQRAIIAGAIVAGLAGINKCTINPNKYLLAEICDALDNDCQSGETDEVPGYDYIVPPDYSGSMPVEDILKSLKNKKKYEGTI